jgi:hypothetical protein
MPMVGKEKSIKPVREEETAKARQKSLAAQHFFAANPLHIAIRKILSLAVIL